MQFRKNSKTGSGQRRHGRVCRWRQILFGAVIVFGVISIAAARAQEGDRQWSFDIPPESLGKALIAFSNTTGIEVAIDARDVRERQSAGVKGTMEAGQALEALLLGNQLSMRKFGATIILSPVNTADQTNLAHIREQSYYANVQSAMLHRLCRLTTTVPGAFRVAVKLWIDRTGKVVLARRLTDTGDDERNAALDNAFEGLDIGAPPLDLRQPILVLVSPNGSSRATCQSARAGVDQELK